MEYDNTNTGALFANKNKDTEKHPDETGTVNIDGVEYWISCWFKTAKSGQPFKSLSFKKKESLVERTKEEGSGNLPEDIIPF